MDIFNLLWNWDQEKQLEEIRQHVEKVQTDRATSSGDAHRLAEENAALQLRLGLLVRLLISKGVITAEEYAGAIALMQPKNGD
jgi:hypothetical protein